MIPLKNIIKEKAPLPTDPKRLQSLFNEACEYWAARIMLDPSGQDVGCYESDLVNAFGRNAQKKEELIRYYIEARGPIITFGYACAFYALGIALGGGVVIAAIGHIPTKFPSLSNTDKRTLVACVPLAALLIAYLRRSKRQKLRECEAKIVPLIKETLKDYEP